MDLRSPGPGMDDRPAARIGPIDETPREWLARRYLPLAWLALTTAVVIHTRLGGAVEWQADAAFLAVNIMGYMLKRAGSRHVVALHMLGLFPLILWYSGAPGGIPDLLDSGVMIFGSLLVLPNIILVSMYGLRAAAVSTGLGLFGMVVLAATASEFAVGAFLVTVSSLIGGVFFHRLVLALEESQAMLAEAAYVDPMTGIGNRRAFAMDFERRANHPVGMVLTLWDLDGLKNINDQEGHAAGDRYLMDFVAALSGACGSACRVYRLGGDEFAGLHAGVEPEELVTAVRDRFESVSVGYVVAAGRTLDDAMAEADRLLYENKAARHPEPEPAPAPTAGLARKRGPAAAEPPLQIIIGDQPFLDSSNISEISFTRS